MLKSLMYKKHLYQSIIGILKEVCDTISHFFSINFNILLKVLHENLKHKCLCITLTIPGLEDKKKLFFFLLNSAEHEFQTANEY